MDDFVVREVAVFVYTFSHTLSLYIIHMMYATQNMMNMKFKTINGQTRRLEDKHAELKTIQNKLIFWYDY